MRTQTSGKWMSRAKREELLARTYVLYIVPERSPSVSRTIEVLATQTLATLHAVIQDAFELDNDHLYAFFMSGRAWDQDSAYEGPGRNAEKVTLQAAGCKAGKEFLYLFDFGDELRHRIRVESQGTREPDVTYPRTLAAVGDPPPQYPNEEDEEGTVEIEEVAEDLRGLADEVARICEEAWEETGTCKDCGLEHLGMDGATLDRHLDVERRLCEAVRGRIEQLDALEAHCEYLLYDWLSALVLTLAGHGRAQEALARYSAWAELLGDDVESLLGSHALLLYQAGQQSEARAVAEEQFCKRSGEFFAMSVLARICKDSGDLVRSEEISRQHYQLAKDLLNLEEQESAGLMLIQLLQARGQQQEAEQLQQTLEALGALDMDEEDEAEDEDEDSDPSVDSEAALRSLPAQKPRTPWAFSSPPEPLRLPPVPHKIGRNDPCACGSGKKYKKCCGGVAAPSSQGNPASLS